MLEQIDPHIDLQQSQFGEKESKLWTNSVIKYNLLKTRSMNDIMVITKKRIKDHKSALSTRMSYRKRETFSREKPAVLHNKLQKLTLLK